VREQRQENVLRAEARTVADDLLAVRKQFFNDLGLHPSDEAILDSINVMNSRQNKLNRREPAPLPTVNQPTRKEPNARISDKLEKEIKRDKEPPRNDPGNHERDPRKEPGLPGVSREINNPYIKPAGNPSAWPRQHEDEASMVGENGQEIKVPVKLSRLMEIEEERRQFLAREAARENPAQAKEIIAKELCSKDDQLEKKIAHTMYMASDQPSEQKKEFAGDPGAKHPVKRSDNCPKEIRATNDARDSRANEERKLADEPSSRNDSNAESQRFKNLFPIDSPYWEHEFIRISDGYNPMKSNQGLTMELEGADTKTVVGKELEMDHDLLLVTPVNPHGEPRAAEPINDPCELQRGDVSELYGETMNATEEAARFCTYADSCLRMKSFIVTPSLKRISAVLAEHEQILRGVNDREHQETNALDRVQQLRAHVDGELRRRGEKTGG